MITIDKKEVYRYLGYRKKMGNLDVSLIDEKIDTCIAAMMKIAHPQSSYRRFPLIIDDEHLRFAGVCTSSANLRKNLMGCSHVYILAATLGMEVDRQIKRAEILDLTDAAIYQAAGAAMIESYVDNLNDQIQAEAQSEGFFVHPRYSPGYGDFPLYHQKAVLEAVNAQRIGITLNDHYLMIPSKSVTAVIGCGMTPSSCETGCHVCDQLDCYARRE